jgi:hypothetical protein
LFPPILVVNWVSSSLSFFLSASTAVIYFFTAPTYTTTIITLEPCALNAEFQHFILRFNKISFLALGLIVKEGIGGEREGDFMDNFNVHVLPIQFEQLFLLLSLLIITFRSVIYRGYWQSKTFQNSFTRYPCGSIASASNSQPNLTCNIRLICPFLHLINQFRLGSWITLVPITSNDSLVCSSEWLHMPHHHCQMMS